MSLGELIDNTKCFREVSETCMYATVSPDAQGAQMLVGDFVSAALTIVKFMAIMFGAEMSDNMLAAINSFRCAMSSGFENVWTLIMAARHTTLLCSSASSRRSSTL